MGFWEDALGVATDVGLGLATGGLYNVAKWATGGYGDPGGIREGIGSGLNTVFGGNGQEGWLGTSQAHIPEFQIDPTALERIQAANIDPRQQEELRRRQLDLMAMLEAQANGVGGPSAAAIQMQQGLDRNLANAMALGQSQRGVGASSALRAIGQNQAAMAQQGVSDAALLRAQEAMSARALLGQTVGQARSQDQQLAQNQAALAQQAAIQNAQNRLALEQIRASGFADSQSLRQRERERAAQARAGTMKAAGDAISMLGGMV